MVKRKESVVPIIQQDLGQEETILQIAFALDSLEKVATNIFCHVECEIEKSKQRLTDVQGRCQKVNSKVLKLTGISKSITVFCSSKYPAPSRDRFYTYDFKHIEVSRPHIKVKYKPLPPEKMSMKEKLKFYHIKDKSQMLRKNIEISPLDGLGGLPSDIKCISSLLLFNTNENLFKNYKIVDPLSYKHKPARVEVRLNKKSEIEPAPISIGLNEDSGYRFERNYFYSPSLQDVPQIEAPANLPHLTGIAGDLRYTVDHPTIEGVTEEDRVSISVDSEPEPAIIEALPKLETSDTETRVAPPPPEMPPPPPPPPPPQPPQPPPPPSLAPAEPTANQRPPSVDLRANLMEAIRNAGGSAKAKLKSVSDLNSIEASSERKLTGNSLMDDLHAKLSMRRKGISGKMENPEGLMERMVSMIPPPPSKPVENEVDEDWDD